MRKVLIRSDASNQAGVGHLMRSVALAQYIQARGIEVHLVTIPWQKSLTDYLSRQAFEVQYLDCAESQCASEEDLHSTLRKLKDGFDWAVLDNYYFESDYQRAVRNTSARLLVVDDRADQQIDADIVVNHVVQGQPAAPQENHGQMRLFGTEYVALRNELVRFSKRKKQGMNHILITLGGSSQVDALTKAMQAIIQIENAKLHVKVILGFLNSPEKILHLASKSKHTIEICQPTLKIEELYNWADFAICAGGGTSWELCHFGIPGIVGALIDHQLNVAELLDGAGIFKSVGWYKNTTAAEIAQTLSSLLDHPDQLEIMRKKALSLVDGKGAERIFNAMQQVEVEKAIK